MVPLVYAVSRARALTVATAWSSRAEPVISNDVSDPLIDPATQDSASGQHAAE
jgi:hypothetical protein